MNYFIKTCEVFGRGLYAAHSLQKDRILFTAELLVLSEEDTKKVNSTELNIILLNITTMVRTV